MAMMHACIIHLRKAARESLEANKKQEKPFGDKEKDKITIPLQLQYADPEERTMNFTRSDGGATVTLPRGITPGGPPEVPAQIKPETVERRGIFPCDADTGAA